MATPVIMQTMQMQIKLSTGFRSAAKYAHQSIWTQIIRYFLIIKGNKSWVTKLIHMAIKLCWDLIVFNIFCGKGEDWSKGVKVRALTSNNQVNSVYIKGHNSWVTKALHVAIKLRWDTEVLNICRKFRNVEFWAIYHVIFVNQGPQFSSYKSDSAGNLT